MRRLIARLVRFLGSLTGRIALILAVGILIASVGALLIAEQGRRGEFMRIRDERVIASALDVLDRLHRNPAATIANLRDGRLVGAHFVERQDAVPVVEDALLTSMLASRTDMPARPSIARAPTTICQASDPIRERPRAAGIEPMMLPDCWLMTARVDGRSLAVAIDLPQLPAPPRLDHRPAIPVPRPGSGARALADRRAARDGTATSPVRSRGRVRPIDRCRTGAGNGSPDVRAALATFNLMQERVRAGLIERTRILAAISHDLQTPLTRLRLRLEQVEDEALRDRLVADLSATLAMMKRGLDLARSGDSAEDWSTVDLDSVLSSLADNAAEFGHAVRFTQGCGALVRVRPDALTRCLSNLIDNAIKHGGDADIASRRTRGTVIITVRDHGPGIPAAMLAQAFDPFVRADTSRSSGDGTGIGLTIARAQATAIGGHISLANHPGGGLEATLTLGKA
ncbi:ATP-binding protein [Sphingomonas aurantiaca]|uniref:sensor histidine kinase n=1 Tax=Sphingomonas aurantiaca TaxID=185949 RepID=UPI002FE32A23